ncbi:MAG: DNA repair protein RadC, partial [Nitrospiraceae bacterium]|nr:DNA repair protein RadC [Nitrospiraceae bacterium]
GFPGVMDASFEELVSVTGIGENSATFLVLLKACASLYLKGGLIENRKISSTMALIDYCMTEMRGLRDEQFRAIFLNSQNEMLADEIIQEGTVDQAVVYPRKVMERALHYKATGMIFVHNHPSGSFKPSREDIMLTEALKQAARSLQLKVHDHLIISRSGYYSFLESGLI